MPFVYRIPINARTKTMEAIEALKTVAAHVVDAGWATEITDLSIDPATKNILITSQSQLTAGQANHLGVELVP